MEMLIDFWTFLCCYERIVFHVIPVAENKCFLLEDNLEGCFVLVFGFCFSMEENMYDRPLQ